MIVKAEDYKFFLYFLQADVVSDGRIMFIGQNESHPIG